MKVLIFIFCAVVLLGCENESGSKCDFNATVKDLSGLDGCGFIFELEDGSRIEPLRPFIDCGTPPLPKEITEDPLWNFAMFDGQKVRISYDQTDALSACMVSPLVKVTCIEELRSLSTE